MKEEMKERRMNFDLILHLLDLLPLYTLLPLSSLSFSLSRTERPQFSLREERERESERESENLCNNRMWVRKEIAIPKTQAEN